jgi:hypothetical protein
MDNGENNIIKFLFFRSIGGLHIHFRNKYVVLARPNYYFDMCDD